MRITKCDLCKKNVKGETVSAGYGFYDRAELCEPCGSPVLSFLRKHKFVKEDNQSKISKKKK